MLKLSTRAALACVIAFAGPAPLSAGSLPPPSAYVILRTNFWHVRPTRLADFIASIIAYSFGDDEDANGCTLRAGYEDQQAAIPTTVLNLRCTAYLKSAWQPNPSPPVVVQAGEYSSTDDVPLDAPLNELIPGNWLATQPRMVTFIGRLLPVFDAQADLTTTCPVLLTDLPDPPLTDPTGVADEQSVLKPANHAIVIRVHCTPSTYWRPKPPVRARLKKPAPNVTGLKKTRSHPPAPPLSPRLARH